MVITEVGTAAAPRTSDLDVDQRRARDRQRRCPLAHREGGVGSHGTPTKLHRRRCRSLAGRRPRRARWRSARAGASPARLAETLAALANTHGGLLLLGVDASRQTGRRRRSRRSPRRGAGGGAARLPPADPAPARRPWRSKAGSSAWSRCRPACRTSTAWTAATWPAPARQNRLLSASELTALLLAAGKPGSSHGPPRRQRWTISTRSRCEAYLDALGRARRARAGSGRSWPAAA